LGKDVTEQPELLVLLRLVVAARVPQGLRELQELLEQLAAVMVELMAVAAVLQAELQVEQVEQVLSAQSVSFGPVTCVHSHLLVQETCK